MSDYPGLEQLVTAYFHQDWVVDYPDARSVVSAFVREDDRATFVPGEIKLLLTAMDDEALHRLIMEEYVCGYPPDSAGKTVREWLTQVAEQITHELAGRRDA